MESNRLNAENIKELLEIVHQHPALKDVKPAAIVLRKRNDASEAFREINEKLATHPVLRNFELHDLETNEHLMARDIRWCEIPPGSGNYQPC